MLILEEEFEGQKYTHKAIVSSPLHSVTDNNS